MTLRSDAVIDRKFFRAPTTWLLLHFIGLCWASAVWAQQHVLQSASHASVGSSRLAGEGKEDHLDAGHVTNDGFPTLALNETWDVLGPLAAGMRESHLGAFPPLAFDSLADLLNNTQPTFAASPYIRGGQASKTTVKAVTRTDEQDGRGDASDQRQVTQSLRIAFPDADWRGIRGTVGWAGVQWQALCASKIKVSCNTNDSKQPVTIRVSALGAAAFAVVAEEVLQRGNPAPDSVEWYNGDWYSYNAPASSGHAVPSHILTLPQGDYRLLVKAVHEVRIHGGGDHESGPEIAFSVSLDAVPQPQVADAPLAPITSLPNLIVPDIVGGNFAGWGVGLAVQNAGRNTAVLKAASIEGEASGSLDGSLTPEKIEIASGQTRPIKIQVQQIGAVPTSVQEICMVLAYVSQGKQFYSRACLPLEHVPYPSEESCHADERASYTFTYLDVDDTIQYAAAVPPLRLFSSKEIEDIPDTPMTIYLHGAGVDIRDRGSQRMLRRQCESWIVAPSGRTPWGYDWQGLSRSSIDSAAEAFKQKVYGMSSAKDRRLRSPSTERFMLVGHSNGGQGVYHYASHWPDRVMGAIVGAGYLRVADYVPMLWQRGRHFVDGALEGILRAAVNPYENNLFASNLAGIPLLVKHGSADDNVPTWHSREMVGLVHDWNRDSQLTEAGLVSFNEVDGKPHMWDGMLTESDVQDALDARVRHACNPGYSPPPPLSSFTLRVANPDETGAKQGWRILHVPVPGRIGRIRVLYPTDGSDALRVQTSNVDEFTVARSAWFRIQSHSSMLIDGQSVQVQADSVRAEDPNAALLFRQVKGRWTTITAVPHKTTSPSPELGERPLGPLVRFLQAEDGPLHLVVPRARCNASTTAHYMSIALRFATDATLYGRIDSVILHDDEVLSKGNDMQPRRMGRGNILLLGGPNVNVVAYFAAAKQSVFHFAEDGPHFVVKGALFAQGVALVALMPNPLDERPETLPSTFAGEEDSSPGIPRTVLMLHGTDPAAIEQGAALLPVRTASMLPEWAVLDTSGDAGPVGSGGALQWKGYGAIVAAGWYDYNWGWSDLMGYLG